MPNTILAIESARVKSVQFHPRRPWVITAMHDGFVEIWDYVVSAQVDRFQAHQSPVRSIAFHPSQPLFATGADDRSIKLWDLESRRCLATFVGHTDYIRYIEFHPGVQPWLVSASDDGSARVWNWQSRQCVAFLVGHREFVMCARFHPRLDILATASMDNSVRIWDLSQINQSAGQKKGLVQQLASKFLNVPDCVVSVSVNGESHTRGANWISWENDDTLYSSSDDTTCKLWRLQRGKFEKDKTVLGPDAVLFCFQTLSGHSNNVNTVQVGSDNILISGSSDGTLRIYESKSRTFVGHLTVADFGKPNTEVSRFWCITQHPTSTIWVAGHDQGFAIFSVTGNQNAVQQVDDNGYGFYVNSHVLKQVQFDQEGKVEQSQVLELAKHPAKAGAFGAGKMIIDPIDIICVGSPFPTVVCYSDNINSFFQCYFSSKTGAAKPVDCLVHPAIVGDKLVYATSKEILFCSINTTGMQTLFKIPVSNRVIAKLCRGFEKNEIVISYDDGGLELSEISDNQLVLKAKIALPGGINDIAFAADQEIAAFVCNTNLYMVDKDLTLVSQLNSSSKFLGIVFGSVGKGTEKAGHCLVYSNSTHIGYLCANNINGIITSLNKPVNVACCFQYVVGFFDQESTPLSTQFDSRMSGLMSAVADGRTGDAAQLVKRVAKADLGIGVISRLVQSGHASYALQLIPDNAVVLRQKLALDLGIFDNFKNIDSDFRRKIVKEAVRQGQGEIAFKYANVEEKAFINSLYDANENIDYSLSGVQERLNASMLMNDEVIFLETLKIAGFHNAAKVYAKSRGMQYEVPEDTPKFSRAVDKVQSTLKPSKRQRPLLNWETKLPQPVLIVEEEPELEAVPEKKTWESEQESSSSSESTPEVEVQKDKKGAKDQWDSDESLSDNVQEEVKGKKLPAVLNPKSQEMKEVGIFAKSQKLIDFIAQITEYIESDNELPFDQRNTDKQYQKALKFTTDGDFQNALELFQKAFIQYKFLIVHGVVTQKQVSAQLKTTSIYLRSLRCEIFRREHQDDEVLSAKLAKLFASQELLPEHQVLAMKVAMNKLKKVDYTSSVEMAKRILSLIGDEDEDLSEKCKKIINGKSKGVQQDIDILKLEFNSFNDCAGEPQECGCCGATLSGVEGACPVCQIGQVE